MPEEFYTSTSNAFDIAVIGMAGRFPGARNIDEFWNILREGKETITFFSEEELLKAGIHPEVLAAPHYVKARGMLEDVDQFDASLFNFPPREAELLDPQQRFFLECAWQALEHAGYNAETYDGSIGVYAGAGTNNYLAQLRSNPVVMSSFSEIHLKVATDKDYLATRVSYKLGLTGPSFTVQTACSTSLVAVHLACQGLLSGECTMALAGGVSISTPQKAGYYYVEGGTSPDGHCRAFDTKGRGPTNSSGVGIVVLKRLEDALADRDTLYAIIKGSAINNDGSLKVGFTAPSIDGQAKAIREAQQAAEVHAETITYVETHGTGTPLGDPIEIAALTRAFRQDTDTNGFCAIGSVKTNMGHLDTAAGVTGLIKTILSLYHRQLPPSLHFDEPNPAIDFPNTPFYVNTQLSEWKVAHGPRRAGVSAFGVGGTNAHVILEEAPITQAASSQDAQSRQIVVLSANTPNTLDTLILQLAEHIHQFPQQQMSDIAYTLQVGRKPLPHRIAFVCQSKEDAYHILKARDPERIMMSFQPHKTRHIAFMFPGAGPQYVGMGRELYHTKGTFREIVDYCANYLKPLLDIDIRTVLYPDAEQEAAASSLIKRPTMTLLTLFVTEYALAQQWMYWGIQPTAMIGHSLGEYVAACLAGVLPLEDALSLVTLRGKLFEQLPPGAMMSVPLAMERLQPLLDQFPDLSLAAINGPKQCVISGYIQDIDTAQQVLAAQGIEVRRVEARGAGHSLLVEPILDTFTNFAQTLHYSQPTIPYLSNVTGTWMTDTDAIDPTYWARHLRHTVRFTEGISRLLNDQDYILLEVGPGHNLSALVRTYPEKKPDQVVLTSLPHHNETRSSLDFLYMTISQCWLEGASINWNTVHEAEQCTHIPLPTYPFEHQRYWVEAQATSQGFASSPATVTPSPTEQTRNAEQAQQASEASSHPRPYLRTLYVAPRNDMEREAAAIWQQTLGIAQIGIHDNFFELGGSSLLATQIVLRLRSTFQVDLPLKALFEAATLAKLTQVIKDLQAYHNSSKATEDTHLDLAGEVTLPIEIDATSLHLSPQMLNTPETAFVTGATGFLGAFILYELLQRPLKHVYCLVRATSIDEGKERLAKNLRTYHLWQDTFAQRCIPVVGDLTQPFLGLTAEQFQNLAQSIDSIYHVGAWVNAAYSYQMLKAANVLGTQEVLRLAAQHKLKPVHYVSTLGVFSATGYKDVPVIYEDNPLTVYAGLEQGYTQTKWVADKLVSLARSRGIPTTIYRPAVILGHSRSGISHNNDYIWRLIKSCLQLGYVPERETLIAMAPVDYVSQAMVELAYQPTSLKKNFHLIAPEPVRWSELFSWLRAQQGYSLKQVPYAEWQQILLKQSQSTQENALYPLLSLFADDPDMAARSTRFDCQGTRNALKQSRLVCPALTQELFQRYVDYFIQTGFLPPPPE